MSRLNSSPLCPISELTPQRVFNHHEERQGSAVPTEPQRELPKDPPVHKPTRAYVYVTGRITNGVTARKFAADMAAAEGADEIIIEFNGPGGELHDAIQMTEVINRSKSLTIGRVTGNCYSALCMPFLACKHRTMTAGSALMMHNVTRGTDDLPDDCIAFSDAIADLFVERSYGIPKATIVEWMRAETYFDAQTSVNMGFANEIDRVSRGDVVDLTGLQQPCPPTSFPETRAFERRLKQKRESMAYAERQAKLQARSDQIVRYMREHNMTPDDMTREFGHAPEPIRCRPGESLAQAKERLARIVTIPPMPASLLGKAIFSMGDVDAVQSSLATTAGSMDARSVYEAEQARQLLKAFAAVRAGNRAFEARMQAECQARAIAILAGEVS